jgi:hypothetical protein
MLKKIAVVVVAVLAALAGFIATRPSAFRIERSRTIAAPQGVVHAFVNDFRKWPAWSPWEKLDPTMKRELSGAEAGVGAVYYWSGNKEVGEGRMTITDSRPSQSVTIRLEFLRPWQATSTTRFDFVPSGSGTRVTWALTGHNNFVAKAVCLFMDMDQTVGKDFEKGLANLEAATTARATAHAAQKATTPTS